MHTETGKQAAWRFFIIALFGLSCIISISLILLWRADDSVVVQQQAGEVALADFMAPRSHTYVSGVKTKELGDVAAANPANNIYKRDNEIVAKERENLTALLFQIGMARTSSAELEKVRKTLLENLKLDSRQIEQLFNLSETGWNQVAQEVRTAYSLSMSRDLLPGDISNLVANLRNAVYAPYTLSASFAQLDEGTRQLVISLTIPYLHSNMVLDEPATKRKQQEARAAVGQNSVTVVKGSAIVRRGDIISEFQIEQMREVGARSTIYSPVQIIGTIGITSILVLLLIFYCQMQSAQIWTHPRWLFFLGACMIAFTFGMRMLVTGATRDNPTPYLLPVATIAMIITALFDINLALFLSSLLAILAAFVSGTPELAAVYFAGCIGGALTIRKAEHTIVFAYAGIAVGISQLAVGVSTSLLSAQTDTINWLTLIFYNGLNGLIAASLAFFCFSVLGKIFGVATVLQLLELAHPNHPLLRRLIREAPGTYHHSVMVGNLAEQAAERLADNALLARVGSYYHDIGKLSRPSFFIDNQGGGANIHDSLDPCESARLIRAHVSDGVALARKHRLPRRVTDIIEQHHGTCVVHYFYQKAVKLGLDVSELDFRYPGPKPQTKVAAIVMLADGCEAAVRANVQSGRILTGMGASVPGVLQTDSTSKKQLTIADVVNKIIEDRIRDNQFSECDLTLRDIEEIRSIFIEVLTSIYHPRIPYPDKEPAGTPVETMPTTTKLGNSVVEATVRELSTELATITPFVHKTHPLNIADTGGAADSGGSPGLSEVTLLERRTDKLN